MDNHTTNLLGAFALGCVGVQASAMAAIGLDANELAALLAVHARPGSRVDDIARTIGLTHSGAVRVVDRLCASGWTERHVGRDRRAVSLRCTRKGHTLARRALALRLRAIEDATATLTANELAALSRAARKVLSALPSERPDAWHICRHCDHSVCSGSDCPVGSAVS